MLICSCSKQIWILKIKLIQNKNSNISSSPSEWGTVPSIQLEFPLCIAMEIDWKRNDADCFSPVSSITFLTISFTSLCPSRPQEPKFFYINWCETACFRQFCVFWKLHHFSCFCLCTGFLWALFYKELAHCIYHRCVPYQTFATLPSSRC